jgi:hypothetical protein
MSVATSGRLRTIGLTENAANEIVGFQSVMAGLVPAIHVFAAVKTWMPGTYAKPRFAL